jgi:murein DD-endopeptidase MepM/ murein hydrolase activator NlpD
MTSGKTSLRVLIVMGTAGLVASLFPATLDAVTQAQVDAACADSRAQLDEYRATQRDFEDAAYGYELALNEVEQVEVKQGRITEQVDAHVDDLARVQEQLEEQAVQMYMMGGFQNPGIILSASSVDEVMTTSEFLSSVTLGGQESINDLIAAKGELNRFQEDLTVVHGELKQAEADSLEFLGQQEEAMQAEQAAYAKLSGRCKDLTAQYDREQAQLRALAAQRAAGSVQVGHFICPFTPGRTSFIDSWGFPRPGGRTHKGVDMFAARGEPMYAVQSGRVTVSSNSLGGKVIYLRADTGHTYYYAHLDGWAVSNGQHVDQRQTIGYNGNTGNARATSPHLHFEIRPNGGAPVNPYPTVRAACY